MKLIFFIILFFSLSTQAQKKKATAAVKTLTTKQLTVLIDKIQKQLDSAEAYLNGDQFVFDPDTKTYSLKDDTLIVVRKGKSKAVQEIKPTAISKRTLIDTIPIPQFSMPYKIETNNLTKEQQDILDLKWQVKFLTSIIDGLYDIIDRQNAKLSLRL